MSNSKERLITRENPCLNLEVSTTPMPGKCFYVSMKHITPFLFQEKREDKRQEETRQFILSAMQEVKRNPLRYSKFYLYIPEEESVYGNKKEKTVAELLEYAGTVGGSVCNWVEKALGFAMELSNGTEETWKKLCNEADVMECFRLFFWVNGTLRISGGAFKGFTKNSASDIWFRDCELKQNLSVTVPEIRFDV